MNSVLNCNQQICQRHQCGVFNLTVTACHGANQFRLLSGLNPNLAQADHVQHITQRMQFICDRQQAIRITPVATCKDIQALLDTLDIRRCRCSNSLQQFITATGQAFIVSKAVTGPVKQFVQIIVCLDQLNALQRGFSDCNVVQQVFH